MAVTTRQSIVERNRRNAQRSTGPRTQQGKSIARRNSLRHGMTANPAIGDVEDAGAYDRFYELLIEQLQPANLIEQSLVDRIAISLWRLQRAIQAETAVGGLAVASVKPEREHVQAWIRDIHEAWQLRLVEVTDPVQKREAIHAGEIEPGQRLVRTIRPGLAGLQRMFDEEIMASASGLSAIMVMLSDLADRLVAAPPRLTHQEIEILAWLLGVPARCFSIMLNGDENGADGEMLPSVSHDPSNLIHQISQANNRDAGVSMPSALQARIDNRLAMLRQQRQVVADPDADAHYHHLRQAAVLPDASVLDRILRYETHAERSLHRCLTQLANLRSQTVETVMASLAGAQSATWNVQPATLFDGVVPAMNH